MSGGPGFEEHISILLKGASKISILLKKKIRQKTSQKNKFSCPLCRCKNVGRLFSYTRISILLQTRPPLNTWHRSRPAPYLMFIFGAILQNPKFRFYCNEFCWTLFFKFFVNHSTKEQYLFPLLHYSK